MLNHRVEHAVELLCHQGCQAVWRVIRALDEGDALAETADLDATEVAAVVKELKAIMAVYEGSCQAPD